MVWRNGEVLSEELSPPARLEGVADVFDDGLAAVVGPDDRDDVEAGAPIEEVVFLEELEGGEGEPALLLGSDGLGGGPRAAGLDLDEDDRVAVARDQVDLAERGPVPAHEDAEAPPAQPAGRLAL